METITFFAPKGGTGRTTAVMTTAAGLIELGHRVGVLDLTHQARWPVGQTDISQWEDSMVASGISATELMTAPGWDRDSISQACGRFVEAGCSRILIDTPKTINGIVSDFITSCSLTVMPFISYHEASWISDWSFSSKFPSTQVYGLATGLTGTAAEKAIHRKAFYGAPLLNTELEHSELFPRQLLTGSLFKPRTCSREADYPAIEIGRARASALALAKELDALLVGRWLAAYPTQRPIATGHPFAHVQALCAASPEAFSW